jgi:DNA-binding transcriptional MerR regulator
MVERAAERLSIGQVARQTGLSVHALRFYEREGLLPIPVGRDTGGRRVYTIDDVSWLRVCVSLRASGMPLAAIRGYAALVRAGAGNEHERLAVLREHQRRVRERLDELAACLELIDGKVAVYEQRLEQGTAAHLWSVPRPDADAAAPPSVEP